MGYLRQWGCEWCKAKDKKKKKVGMLWCWLWEAHHLIMSISTLHDRSNKFWVKIETMDQRMYLYY